MGSTWKSREILMPAHGKWDCRTMKPFLAIRKEPPHTHFLLPLQPREHQGWQEFHTDPTSSGCGFRSCWQGVQAYRTRAPPCTGKLCPCRDQSLWRECLPMEGPTLWQVDFYLWSQCHPGPTLYISSLLPISEGERKPQHPEHMVSSGF